MSSGGSTSEISAFGRCQNISSQSKLQGLCISYSTADGALADLDVDAYWDQTLKLQGEKNIAHAGILHFFLHFGKLNTFSDVFFSLVNMYQEPAATWYLGFGLKTAEGFGWRYLKVTKSDHRFSRELTVSYILSCLFNLCKHLSFNRQLRPRLILGSEQPQYQRHAQCFRK